MANLLQTELIIILGALLYRLVRALSFHRWGPGSRLVHSIWNSRWMNRSRVEVLLGVLSFYPAINLILPLSPLSCQPFSLIIILLGDADDVSDLVNRHPYLS